MMNCQDCNKCGQQVAWIAVAVNAVFALAKFLVGYASGSRAMLADGLHSLANIITAFAILVSRKLTNKAASSEYHFGFGKAEFLAAGFSSLLIIIGSLVLIVVSIKHLLSEPVVITSWAAPLLALVSIAANEMLFRYMRCVGGNLKSQTIMASAWANRADAFSSFAVLLGIVGTKLGIPHLDPIAALVVVAAIVKICGTMLIDSLKSLMDVSVNSLYREEIKDLVRGIEGVRAMENLKTRQVGHYVWAELDVLVDPLHSLKNAGFIGDMVQKALLGEIRDLERVTVHTRPVSVPMEESESADGR